MTRNTVSEAPANAADLAISHLAYAYDLPRGDRLQIFSDLSLTTRPGEFISVIGPSGCGKSTILRIVAGLIEPTSGSVAVGGVPVTGPTANAAMVFQDDRLLPWRTAVKNVMFSVENTLPKKEARRRSMEALRLVGLEEFASSYPHQLSGGMRQRINLARALVADPQLLLMDEPFAALDAQSRERHQMSLLEVWASTGKTVVFVTHDLDEAILLADRVLIFGRRGAGIVGEVQVPFPRPREVGMKLTEDFIEIARDLRQKLAIAEQ